MIVFQICRPSVVGVRRPSPVVVVRRPFRRRRPLSCPPSVRRPSRRRRPLSVRPVRPSSSVRRRRQIMKREMTIERIAKL